MKHHSDSLGNNPNDKLNSIPKSELDNEFLPNRVPKLSQDKKKKTHFPLEVFPQVIQDIILELNDAYTLPIDFYGAGILTCAATVIGKGFKLKHKKYSIPPNLFMAMVGGVSIGKTPTINFCIQPIKELDKDLYKEYKQELVEIGNDKTKAKPSCKNLIVSDTTTEAVSKALKNTPNGLLLYRDELVGWIKSMNQYRNNGADEEYWLTAWNGRDIKINRTSTDVEVSYIFDVRICIIGGLQPSVLRKLTANGKSENGFLARILFAYPDNPKKPKETDKEPRDIVFSVYQMIIHKLYELCKPNNEKEIEQIPLSSMAKQRYRQWQHANTNFINEELDSEVLKGITSKIEPHCLRFALVLQLLHEVCKNHSIDPSLGTDLEQMNKDVFPNIDPLLEVSLDTMNKAIQLSEYFKRTSEKVLDRVFNYNPLSSLTEIKRKLYRALPKENFTLSKAKELAKSYNLSESTIKRFLKQNPKLFKQVQHGIYTKLYT